MARLWIFRRPSTPCWCEAAAHEQARFAPVGANDPEINILVVVIHLLRALEDDPRAFGREVELVRSVAA